MAALRRPPIGEEKEEGHAVREAAGFTLIELLVVIAIIAILAAIHFSFRRGAQKNALKSTCQSNLKQMGSAFMMYYQDFDEEYPLYRFDAPGSITTWCYWPRRSSIS